MHYWYCHNGYDCKICNMDSGLFGEWAYCLRPEFEKTYFQNILEVLHDCDERGEEFFPEPEDILNFTRYFDLSETKVVILGQDPYPGGLATGLAFSTPHGTRYIPPSISTIFKEVYKYSWRGRQPECGSLERWAQQGVLLLNSVLTVEFRKPKSHSKIGWQIFTDHIIKYISDRFSNVVFMLWGYDALQKIDLIDDDDHLVLSAGHPSPKNRLNDFIGCNHFYRANGYLCKIAGRKPINWWN